MKRSFNVKNKNKNIDKFFSEKLPDPEIPTDDAWGKMSDMLPATPAAGKLQQIFWGSTFKLLSMLILVGIVSVGVVLFLKNNKKEVSIKNEKSAGKAISGVDQHNRAVEKVGKADITVEGIETERGVESERGVKKETDVETKGDVETERSVKAETDVEKKTGVKTPESNEPGKRETTETIVKTKRAYKTERRETLAKYLGRNNVVTKAPDNISTASKPSPESNRNGSKTAASKHSGNMNATTQGYKRLEVASLFQIKSLPFKPASYEPGFSAKVKVSAQSSKVITKNIPKEPRKKSFEVGLEWSLNSPLKQTDYLFTDIDSIKKPALLLIPGIYATKSFHEKHALTLSLSGYQPYFGNNGKLAQDPDSLSVPDSSLVSLRTTLVKTAGINLALQYQYEFVNHFKIGAGVAYSRIYGALVQEQIFNDRGEPLHPKLVTLKGSEQIGRYLHQNIFYFKAGLSYETGRFQTGINISAPLGNITGSPQYPIRAINGQLFVRFRIL
ncbi:hypothetical protein [Dyadobacter sp. CY347]|uniref:hypothetical protein n=1 Tax=Dyadobacter sp. CY347 TaxID=2909336 RepID=UPI001F4056AD|nr:hypothetical protein [Dyadobacter sp. CY347]MCF2489874.1 hypothetical protein [Dyadobacter sp. CY347]